MQIAGVIEGFYGRPWTWDERVLVCRWAAARRLGDYVYAPKDDPKHRAAWREPYDDEELAGFSRIVTEGGVRLGFAISPGLSIEAGDPGDRAALAAKVDQILDVGARLVVLALDDIPFGGGPQGRDHAALTAWLRDHLGERATLCLVPTEYVGVRPTPYLDALAKGVPEDVPIGWTGISVVPRHITTEQARARADALGGRPPLLWDNAAANDAVMIDRLPIGPLRGRDPGLREELAGYLANPCCQPRAARVHLGSVAAWLRGGDPEAAWVTAAEELGARTLAESVDGEVPRGLVAEVIAAKDPGDRRHAAAALRAWLQEASRCDAGDLGPEVEAWVDQTRTEAGVALAALDLFERCAWEEQDAGPHAVVGLALQWRAVRLATTTVMGSRLSLMGDLGQRPDGTWSVRPGLVIEGRSATDALARAALVAARALDPDPRQ
jgi:hyaluronoglucosaminidase